MNRREFITLLGGAAVGVARSRRARSRASGCGASACSRPRPGRSGPKGTPRGIPAALQQLGWTDGHNVRIDYRFAAANLENYHKYADELVALAPDVILALANLW